MKSALIVAAAAALCGGLPALAQSADSIAVAPPSTSTGPTVPDTRKVDQNTIQPPGSPATTNSTTPRYGNWRSSDGLNTDPNNPDGAPGNSSVATNPSR